MVIKLLKKQSFKGGFSQVFVGSVFVSLVAFAYIYFDLASLGNPKDLFFEALEFDIGIAVFFSFSAAFYLYIISTLFISGILKIITYKASNVYKSMKKYGDPEDIIERIENAITTQNYLDLYCDEKSGRLFFIDKEEMLGIYTYQTSGYVKMKDAMWSYYDPNGYKDNGMLYLWGRKKINSFKMYMPKNKIAIALEIIEQNSDCLVKYIDNLRLIRDFNYSFFNKKTIVKISNKP